MKFCNNNSKIIACDACTFGKNGYSGEQERDEMEGEQKTTTTIHDLPESERPRERLQQLGAAALTNAELMAILLRVGMEGKSAVALGEEILRTFGGIKGVHATEFDELQNISGVGQAKAAQIKAAIELGYRLSQEEWAHKVKIDSPRQVYELFQHDLPYQTQEELWVLLLDTRNHVTRRERIYIGTVNNSSVRLAEVFEPAIRAHCAGIILVHNHPSGDPSPSPEDGTLTDELVKAGRMLDIRVLDHIVIGQGRFYSFKAEKRLS